MILLVGERLRRRVVVRALAMTTGRPVPATRPRSDPDPDAGIEGPEADLLSDQRLAGLSMNVR